MKKVLKLAKTYTEANRSFAPLAIQDKHKKNKMKKNLMLKKPSHNQFPSHNQLTGHNQFPPPNPPTQPPQLKKLQPTGYSNESIPIHKYSATRPPGLFFFTHSTQKLKKFCNIAYHSFHNILTIRPLTTTNELMLTNIVWFPHFHGHHTTTSLTH